VPGEDCGQLVERRLGIDRLAARLRVAAKVFFEILSRRLIERVVLVLGGVWFGRHRLERCNRFSAGELDDFVFLLDKSGLALRRHALGGLISDGHPPNITHLKKRLSPGTRHRAGYREGSVRRAAVGPRLRGHLYRSPRYVIGDADSFVDNRRQILCMWASRRATNALQPFALWCPKRIRPDIGGRLRVPEDYSFEGSRDVAIPLETIDQTCRRSP
jgi:hypothetical protein